MHSNAVAGMPRVLIDADTARLKNYQFPHLAAVTLPRPASCLLKILPHRTAFTAISHETKNE
jgi:hypothetical protein